MEDNKIYIKDENGKEVEMNILFTFDNEDTKYVITYKDNEDEVFAFKYDEENNLYVVEDEEEIKLVNEVLEAFDKESNDEEGN